MLYVASIVLALMGSPSPAPNTVDIVPFFGDAAAHELYLVVESELIEHGLAVTVVAPPLSLGPREHLADPIAPGRLQRVHQDWLAGDPGSRFLVVGGVEELADGRMYRVRVYDRDDHRPVARLDSRAGTGELLLPIVLPTTVARTIDEQLHPPPPATERELAVLAQLDEPPLAFEEEPDPCILGCCLPSGPGYDEIEFDPSSLEVDLREDFPAFCRKGPPRRRGSKDEPVDLRPPCRMGPALGYVRPRTWVTGSAALLTAAATGAAFGLRRAGWSTAGVQLGDHQIGAPLTAWGSAAAVATGALVMGTIVLITADRRRARRFIREEKALAKIR